MRKVPISLFLCLIALFSLALNPVHTIILVANQTIGVSATVPPKVTDFQFNLTSLDEQETVSQAQILSYQITYGAKSSAGVNAPATIVVDWSHAMAPDGSSLVEYIPGSATHAYGDTPSIVDIHRKTITWNIPVLPSSITDQKITFKFKTTKNYSETVTTPLTIRTTMSNQYVLLPEQSVTKTYSFTKPTSANKILTSPTIPPSTKPSLPPIIAPTAIVSPTISPTPSLTIADISLRSLSQAAATLAVRTTLPSKLLVNFGTSPRSLSESIALLQLNENNTITFTGLTPATTYYVQITATDPSGQRYTSEIFTFRTADQSQAPLLEDNIVVLTSNGDILLSDVKKQADKGQKPVALLTTDSNYEFTYRLKQRIPLTSITAIVRNKVLGITSTSYAQESSDLTIPMIEKEPLVYVANLKTFVPGDFEVFVKVVDTKGNILEQKIADVKVMPRLSIVDSQTKQPIADARVFLYFYNQKTHAYEQLSRTLFKKISNPNYTNMAGEVEINLPQGKYQANVSSFGYDEKVVEFILGPNQGEEFPQISLQKNPTSIANLIRYYNNATIDFIANFTRFLNSLSLSLRFFNLIAFVVVSSFIFISFLLFTMRTHIRFSHIPSFFFHNIEKLFQRATPTYLSGIVVDELNQPLTRAHIECLHAQTGKVLGHLDTNKAGKFYLKNFRGHALKLITTRDGYMESILLLHPDVEQIRDGLRIVMQSGVKHHPSIMAAFWEQIENIAGMFFEFVLVFTLIIECFFFSLFTFTSTLPFFMLSFLNILLWIFFIRERFEQKFVR